MFQDQKPPGAFDPGGNGGGLVALRLPDHRYRHPLALMQRRAAAFRPQKGQRGRTDIDQPAAGHSGNRLAHNGAADRPGIE